MMVTVYRRRQPPQALADTTVIKSCRNREEDAMFGLAIRTGQPVLMTLDGESSIVKIAADGDEKLSYDALYDTALTATDLRRMNEAGVERPEDVPLETFDADVAFAIEGTFSVLLRVAASSNRAVKQRIKDLHESDVVFREELYNALYEAIRREGDLIVAIQEVHINHDPDEQLKPDGAGWEIVEQ